MRDTAHFPFVDPRFQPVLTVSAGQAETTALTTSCADLNRPVCSALTDFVLLGHRVNNIFAEILSQSQQLPFQAATQKGLSQRDGGRAENGVTEKQRETLGHLPREPEQSLQSRHY